MFSQYSIFNIKTLKSTVLEYINTVKTECVKYAPPCFNETGVGDLFVRFDYHMSKYRWMVGWMDGNYIDGQVIVNGSK